MKNKVFVNIVDPEDENWDVLFRTCSSADLKRILDADFVNGFRINDVEDKMDFLNHLPS